MEPKKDLIMFEESEGKIPSRKITSEFKDDKDDKKAINSLMNACIHNPKSIESLANRLLRSSNDKIKKEVLLQLDSNDNNALMLICNSPPIVNDTAESDSQNLEYIKSILWLMSQSLTEEECFLVLSQQNKEGKNALMLATQHGVKNIIEAMRKLTTEQQTTISNQVDKEGRCPMFIAAGTNEASVSSLIAYFDELAPSGELTEEQISHEVEQKSPKQKIRKSVKDTDSNKNYTRFFAETVLAEAKQDKVSHKVSTAKKILQTEVPNSSPFAGTI